MRTAYTPINLVVKLKQLKEEKKPYVMGADPITGSDPIRDAILDRNTTIEDIAYLTDEMISMYKSMNNRIERALELCVGKSFEETSLSLGMITGIFNSRDLAKEEPTHHILEQVDFTVEAIYFRLGIEKTNSSSLAGFIEESLTKAKTDYDESVGRARTFQKEQLANLQ
ncbi:MAG: hypothetical protein Q8R18_05570 [bacterium]|nr:hypothetical protein [bacterium]